ncbi:MAG: sigma factor-like helix-turn-helix DNA-binding protein [Eubacteriales bacterium]
MLPTAERDLIHALFFTGETVVSLAKELGIPRRTLSDFRDRILKKLRKMMESKK